MQEPERNKEVRAVPQHEEHAGEERVVREVPPLEEAYGGATPMMRGASFPAWAGRISWGSVLAGVFVAIAAQLLLSALGVLVGFGAAAVTTIAELRDISAGIGIWTAISALISLFIGGWVASRLSNTQLSSDGLWHGLTVWAFTLVAGILLSTLGISGLLGFATNAVQALGGVTAPGVTPTPGDLSAAADVAATSAGYFLLGSILGLGAALLGGWFGSARRSRSEAMMEEPSRKRMAA